jgi:1,4-dihydroxy-6-naphthoate synthase
VQKLTFSIKRMRISIGFSPCPNDTFMFAAMVNQWIDTHGFSFDVHLEDVETLNIWSGEAKLDMTKLSFARALAVERHYQLLNAGAALGRGCGPLLITKRALGDDLLQDGVIAVPGEWTTAHLLFRLFYPLCGQKLFCRFDEIEDKLIREEVDAGVIIHENRFTYEARGLVRLADLGEIWEQKTGLPIPLGGIFISKNLDAAVVAELDAILKASIVFAFEHPEKVMEYVRPLAQEMNEEVMRKHIDLYVNDFSLDLGETGRKAVEELKKFSSGSLS